MITIPEKITPPLNSRTILSINHKVTGPFCKANIRTLNLKKEVPVTQQASGTPSNRQQAAPQPVRYAAQKPISQPTQPAMQRISQPHGQTVPSSPASAVSSVPQSAVPSLVHPLQKGQKTTLPLNGPINRLEVRFGWNYKDARCDMDASVFPVTGNGRVPDDSWFVFYGQSASPDRSVLFKECQDGKDREVICVDLVRLNPAIIKLVFVLTINEAFEQNLNFSMIQDAYIRLMDAGTKQEIVSFLLKEYYENVTSMTIGELYLHNGQWKFNPVGNGVHQDLAGQCAIYGVQIE